MKDLKSNDNMTEGSILNAVVRLFIPIALGIFFQQLYNTSDAIIVGNFVGKEALASVGGPTGAIVNLIVGFFTGVSSGSAVIISQMYGAKNSDGISKTVHTSIMLAILSGLIFTIAILLFAADMLRLMGTPEDIMDYSIQYFKIYSIGMIPSLIYNMGASILRATGDTKRPLFYLIITCVINVVLDIIFIVCFKLEVAGAAIATVISQVISALIIISALYKSDEDYKFLPSQLKFTGSILGRIIYIGIPAGLQSVMYSSSNIVVQTSINSFGTDTIAAWAAYSKLDAFLWMTVNSVGVAVMTFTGQNFGARKYERIHKCVKISLILTVVITVVMGSVMIIFGKNLLSMFNSDKAVISIGFTILRFLVILYIIYVPIEIFAGVLRGVGDAIVPTLITCFGICVLRILWIIVAVPIKYTLFTTLMSYPVTWIVTTLMFVIYYFKGKWLKV